MSWLSEEWKEKLPVEAVTNIQTMEVALEKHQKDLAQLSCKTESLEILNEKSKQVLDEKNKEIQTLEREKFELETKLDNENSKNRNLVTSVKNKDDTIRDLTDQLDHCKSKVIALEAEVSKLNNQLDNLDIKCGITSKLAEEGNSKLTEAHEISKQMVEELKLQLNEILKEKKEQENSYEEKLKSALKEEQRWSEHKESLGKQISSLELKVQALENEKRFLETKVSEVVEEQSNAILLEKDDEINKLKDELASYKDQKCIGTYLGIDLPKLCSDSELKVDDRPQLILHNKSLQEEIKHLRDALRYKGVTVDRYVQVSANVFDQKEIILSRMEDTADGVYETSFEGVRHVHSPSYAHGPSCLQLSEELFESKAILKSYKEEILKLKRETSQMKEVYENHIKVCASQHKLRNKLSNRMSSEFPHVSVDELKKRLFEEQQIKHDLLSSLQEQESKCQILENKLSSNENLSYSALCKLEELVDVILQQRNNNSVVNNSSATNTVLDLERFFSQVTNKISSLQEELAESLEISKESIANSTEQILSFLRSHPKLQKHFIQNPNQILSPSKSKYQEMFCGNGIQELDDIKDRICSVQEIITSNQTELKQVENERNHLKEELIKMVNTMKKKDAEFNHLSCLYETEKRKVDEKDSNYRQELDDLKREQLEIYQEYRDMCESLKKKEIELLNKSKQLKLNLAEWRGKEEDLNNAIIKLEQENGSIKDQVNVLRTGLCEKSAECDLLIAKLVDVENQVRPIYDKMSRIEDMFYKAKTQNLYN